LLHPHLKAQIKFTGKEGNQFFSTLRKRVDAYFTDNGISKNANAVMISKTVVLLSAYLLPFILLLVLHPAFGLSLALWFVMGLAVAGIGMSVMHDANHGSYSTNPTVNYLMGHTLNLLGGSVFNWKLQHNVLHHTYTNIVYMDDDIADRLVLKFSPHTKVKVFHKFQWIYAIFFYGLMTLYWVFAKDIVQFIRYTKNGVVTNTPEQNRSVLLKMILLKVIYLFAMLSAPTLFFAIPFYQVFAGFVLMHFVAGIVLTVVFQLAHTLEGTTHPLPDAQGNIENDWAIHQMETTIDFSPGNKILSWYVGGLNYQVEHHLFPKICHVHYPAISKIVEQTAKEFNVPYKVNNTFALALKSHFEALYRFGRLPSPNEAIV